jgi:hypothetical protein
MRVLLALLLLANLGFFALSQGWLAPYAALPAQAQREPQRLAAQVEPDRVRVLDAQAACAPPGPPVASPLCLQAGPFSAAQIDAAEAALASLGLPAAAWQRVRLTSDSAGADQFGLRVDAADDVLRERLGRLPPTWPGGNFGPCP